MEAENNSFVRFPPHGSENPSCQKEMSHVSASEPSKIDDCELQIATFRRRKRSYDSCDSDSDDSSKKWLKLEYEPDSLSNFNSAGDLKCQNYPGFSNTRGWKGKYKFLSSYSLRPRQRLKKCWSEGDADIVSNRGSRKGSRCRVANRVALSKYRRNTANARERERMREINSAFTTLRGVLPSFATAQMASMTKITTLQLASSYIRALSNMLKESEQDSSSPDDASGKASPSSSFSSEHTAKHEFNNNTSLSNMNLVSGSSRQSEWESKFTQPEESSCASDGPGGGLSLDTFLSREAAEAETPSYSATGCSRAQHYDSEDALHSDTIFSWADLTADQNFNWDSN